MATVTGIVILGIEKWCTVCDSKLESATVHHFSMVNITIHETVAYLLAPESMISLRNHWYPAIQPASQLASYTPNIMKALISLLEISWAQGVHKDFIDYIKKSSISAPIKERQFQGSWCWPSKSDVLSNFLTWERRQYITFRRPKSRSL